MLLQSQETLDVALADLQAQSLDFVLVTGDLTKDGEKVNHELMAKKLATLRASGKKVLVIPGNHDINNPHALSYTTSPPTPVAQVSPAEFRQVYADDGYADAVATDPNSLSYVAEPVAGVRVLAIDSCEYADNVANGTPTTAGALSATTLAWVLDQVKAAKDQGKLVIGMMHHGILEHYTGQSIQFPEYVLTDWQTVSKTLADAGLNVVFTGHFHANDIALKDFTTSVLHDIETGSLVTAPSPYRTVDLDIKNRTLAVATTTVTSIASHPTDFVSFSQDFLSSGLTGITKAQLSAAPYNLVDPQLTGVTSLLVPAMMAHYAGDERPGATATAAFTSMIQSTDLMTQLVGESLAALWTDLAPADNNGTITIGSK